MTSRLTPIQKKLLRNCNFSENTIKTLNNPNINLDQRVINEILSDARKFGKSNFRQLHPHFEKIHYHIHIKNHYGSTKQLHQIFIGSDKISDIKLAIIDAERFNSTNKKLNEDNFDLYIMVGGSTLVKLVETNTILESGIPQYDHTGFANSSLIIILR